MGLFDRFKKKNQEEEAVQEKNTAQDTAEEQVRDPEEKMQDPARTDVYKRQNENGGA